MYNEISSNKRKSFLLIFFFAVFVFGLATIFGASQGDPALYFIPACVIATISSLSGYYYSDSLVLTMSHAKRIEEKDNRELYRTLENLCITTGLPMPKLYIIDDTAPNAFATGRDPKHAAIAVTKGLLLKLKKVEIEGVLAHELSHIKNYDTLIMTLVVVFAGIIVLMSDFFIRMSFYRRRGSSRNGGGAAIMMVIGLVMAILSPIFAKLIQLAISRQREFLADASAVLITRYPEGLAQALEKIANDHEPLEVANKATAHLYIYNPLRDHKKSWLNNLFSTHPPVKERVRRLRKMGH